MSASGLAMSDPVRPSRRRRWPWVLLAIVVILGGGLVAADVLARGWAQDLVGARLAAALEVDDPSSVDVRIEGPSVLLQAVTGSLSRVDVRIPELQLHELRGDLDLRAEGVPLDFSQPVRALDVRYAIPEAVIAEVAPSVTGAPIESIEFAEPEVIAGGRLAVLGLSLDLGLGITPSTDDGALVFTPSSVRIGDLDLTADELRANPLFGSLADSLLQKRTLCVADALPAALTLTDTRVEGELLIAELDGSGEALGGTGFAQKGVCGG